MFRQHKERAIAESVAEKRSGDKAEDGAPDGPTEAYQTGDGADRREWEDVSRDRHDESRPGLLGKERDAEQH